MARFSRKKLLLFGFLAVLLLAIPLTVFVVQKEQETRTRAQAATVLQLCPPPPEGNDCPGATEQILSQTVQEGDEVKVDVKVNPDINALTWIRFTLNYDPEVLTLKEDEDGDVFAPYPKNSLATRDFVVRQGFPQNDPEQGGVTVEMEVTNLTPGIAGIQTLGTFTFVAEKETVTEDEPDGSTTVSFGQDTDARSSLEAEPREPVLKTKTNTTIIIQAAEEEPSEEPKPSDAPEDETGEGGTKDETSQEKTNKPPVCESFTADKEASTSAPFLVTFTTEGHDPDGIVNKVTFNFGDGSTNDLTDTGGLGEEASVSAEISHTYQSAGEFSANATFTDDNDATSDPNTCSKLITISGGVETITPQPTLPPTGPDRTIIGVGILGAILTVLGFVIFFAL